MVVVALSHEHILDVARSHVGPTSIPGLSLLVAHGDDVLATGLGVLGSSRGPVLRDSIFRISSMSKPLTASLILHLISEERLAIDDDVSTWLPELASLRVLRTPDGPLEDTVAALRAITVRDLLTFTNGFGMTMAMFTGPTPWPIFLAAEVELSLATLGPPNPAAQPDPDTWMSRLGSLPLIAQPGSRFLYNTGAAILGVLAARVTNSSLGEALTSRILAPAGMIDTGFFTRSTARLATAYRSSSEGLVVLDEAEGVYSRPPAFPDGGAGLVSTVDDLYAFSQFLRHGANGAIRPELIEQMTSDQLSDAQKVDGAFGDGFFAERSWGYGVAVGLDGSWGWDGGLGTSFWIHPELDLSVIVLTQRMWDSPDLPLAHREIRQAAIDVFA
jgi:CubicO group peptidase (beta-lactamase class C family)